MIKNFPAEHWRNPTYQESRAEARNSLEKVAETSTVLLLSAERGSLWTIPSRPKELSSFQPFCCFWLFRRPSMDRLLRLRALNKSRLFKKARCVAESDGGSPGRATTALRRHCSAHSRACGHWSCNRSRATNEKSKAEAELTPKTKELGNTTATYRIFSQDPFAAPRINNEPLDPRFPGYFRIPGTSTLMRIGGYAKTDFIYDLKPAGNVDSFIPATIPVPSITGINNSTISVRATRVNLDFLVPTKSGDSYRFFFEMDFFGTNSTTPKLRHAYGQAKNFLVGQTFSNFMDPDSGADTLDYQGPNARSLSVTHSSATACLWQIRPPSASRPRSRLRTYFL